MATKKILIEIEIKEDDLEIFKQKTTWDEYNYTINTDNLKINENVRNKLEESLNKLLKDNIIESYCIPIETNLECFWNELIYKIQKNGLGFNIKKGGLNQEDLYKYLLNTDQEWLSILYYENELKEFKEFLNKEKEHLEDYYTNPVEEVKDEIFYRTEKIKALKENNQNSTLRMCILYYVSSKYQPYIGSKLLDKIEFLNKIDDILKSNFTKLDLDTNKTISKIIGKLINIEMNADDYFEEEIDYEKLYFDTMTDGQLGDYDDYKGDDEDIENWSGK